MTRLPTPLDRAVATASAALLILAIGAAPALAKPLPDRIDLPNGWAPEGITAGPGTTVYVGSLANGGVLQADVRTGTTSPLVTGTPNHPAVGVEYEADANRLWVAGGGTGEVRVYDASSGAPLATYTFSPAVFLNDLVVTDDAVYVTDSGIQQLDVIPLGPADSLPDPSEATTLPLSGEISFVPNQFNANGIVAVGGWLIVVQSNTGQLFRVDPATGEATEINLGAADVRFGDGLEVHDSTLYVVQNQLNRLEVFRLAPDLESASFRGFRKSHELDVPTTVAWVSGWLYPVNARFGTPVTADTEYWITRLPD
jgi:sugar lactone lactonase YvrE